MELSRTVGWFTATHPVRLDPGVTDFAGFRSGGPAAGSALKRVKEQLRAVPGDGLGHGMLRRLNPDTATELATRPAAQIGFNYLGRFAAADTGGRDWTPAPEAGAALGEGEALPVPHGIEALGVVRDEAGGGPRLTLLLAWPERLLAEPDARRLLDGWHAMLAGLAEHATRGDSGGHTPSDFLIAMDQSQIDDLEATLADEWSTR
jgi:non-ribosomal peptide synthase protein (TIGR01720 family)